MNQIFQKAKIGSLELDNKIIMAPMCMYQSDDSGKVKKFHKYHYTARALGKVGLIIVEATAIEPRGRISNKDLGLWEKSQIKGHKKLVELSHKFGSKIAVQIAHAGRKATVKETTPIAPSNIAFSPNEPFKTPKAMSKKDIEKIKKKFVKTALNAKKVGYDAIELHAAHGYLFCEFLSPISNQRDDKYGGSLKNRCRIVLETAKEIKKELDLPLIVRISAEEWMDKGWNIEDSIYLSKELEKIGVDAIHVSAGGNQEKVDNMPKLEPLYQCTYAKKIKEQINIPVIAVGLITTPSEGEEILNNKTADFVALGRELLREPNFMFKAAKQFKYNGYDNPSYLRAY
ncbi:MAG: NADH:flavin oxidoreductase/NADH oxidase [Halarcobacter sp.]